MKKCHNCGQEWVSEKKRPGFKEYCEQCTAYLHSCLNCHFYDPNAHNSCRIGTTEWVADKRGSNFCEEFEFSDAAAVSSEDAKKEKARAQLDSLFGEGKSARAPETPADARNAFDKLFGG